MRARHLLPKGLLGSTGGNPAVEMALVLPVFLALIYGVIEFGRVLWTLSTLHYAVEEAARCASINTTTCGTSTQIKAYAAARASTIGVATSVFTPTTVACGHKVAASYVFPFAVSGFMPYTITLTAQSCFPS